MWRMPLASVKSSGCVSLTLNGLLNLSSKASAVSATNKHLESSALFRRGLMRPPGVEGVAVAVAAHLLTSFVMTAGLATVLASPPKMGTIYSNEGMIRSVEKNSELLPTIVSGLLPFALSDILRLLRLFI